MGNDRADDTARFMQAIAAFSAAPEPVTEFGRQISTVPTSALQSLLTEINETVLRREVCFRSDHGDLLTLDIAERRLLRIVAVSEILHAAAPDDMIKDLTPEDAGDVVRLLQYVQDTAQRIFVSAGLPSSHAPTGFTGVSVRDLQEALSSADVFAHLPEPLAHALRACRSVTSGIVVENEGTMAAQFGQQENFSSLSDIAAQISLANDTGDQVCLWQSYAEHDKTVIAAQLGEYCVCLLVPKSEMTATFTQLYRATFPRA